MGSELLHHTPYANTVTTTRVPVVLNKLHSRSSCTFQNSVSMLIFAFTVNLYYKKLKSMLTIVQKCTKSSIRCNHPA